MRTVENTGHVPYLLRESLIWPEHRVCFRILVMHLSISPVILNLKAEITKDR